MEERPVQALQSVTEDVTTDSVPSMVDGRCGPRGVRVLSRVGKVRVSGNEHVIAQNHCLVERSVQVQILTNNYANCLIYVLYMVGGLRGLISEDVLVLLVEKEHNDVPGVVQTPGLNMEAIHAVDLHQIPEFV